MQFTTAALALVAASTTISASPLTARQSDTSCPVVQQGDHVWKISKFSSRQLNGIGKGTSALSFNIKATNGGTLDFDCSKTDGTVEDKTYYQCGDNSMIYFSWSQDRNALLLKQNVADNVTEIGTTTCPNVCRAGGSGPNDFVCDGVSDAYVTLVQAPAV